MLWGIEYLFAFFLPKPIECLVVLLIRRVRYSLLINQHSRNVFQRRQCEQHGQSVCGLSPSMWPARPRLVGSRHRRIPDPRVHSHTSNMRHMKKPVTPAKRFAPVSISKQPCYLIILPLRREVDLRKNTYLKKRKQPVNVEADLRRECQFCGCEAWMSNLVKPRSICSKRMFLSSFLKYSVLL